MPHVLFGLPPIAISAFKEVIEGPARLSRPPIEIEPKLVHQLLADLDSADALPLLAFTLERLRSLSASKTKLSLVDYRDHMGASKARFQRR